MQPAPTAGSFTLDGTTTATARLDRRRVDALASRRCPGHRPERRTSSSIVLDDTGFAQLGCFGSDIATPQHRRLADGGLRYNRFHVTVPVLADTGRRSSPGATTTPSAWGSWPTSRSASPATRRRIPKSRGHAAADPVATPGYSTMAVGKWHLAHGSSARRPGPFDQLAARPRLRALLRLPPGRRQPLGAEPGSGQPLRRPAAPAGGRLPPDRGPGRPGHRGTCSTSSRPRRASRSSCTSRSAPCTPRTTSRREWVEPYRGAFDDGWDAWRRGGLRPPVSRRGRPRRHGADRAAAVGAGLGRAVRRRAAHARPPAGGVRRVPHPHRRPDRPAPRLPRGDRAASTTRSCCSSPTTAPAPRAASSAALNEHRFTARIRRVGGGQPGRLRRLGRLPRPTTTTRGPGRGPATRRSGSGSATRGWAGRGRRSSCTGRRDRRRAGAVRTQFGHVIDLMPTVLDAVGLEPPGRGRRRHPAAGRRRQPPRRRSPTPARPDPRDTQYFEMLGSRSIVHRRLEGDDRPRLDRRPRRGASSCRRQPGLRRRPLGPVRPRQRLLRVDRRRRRAPRRRSASSQELWLAEAGRNHVLPVDDTFVNRFGRHRSPRPGRRARPDVPCPAAVRCPTSRCRCCSAASGSPPTSTSVRASPTACCSPSATGTAATPSSSRRSPRLHASPGRASCSRSSATSRVPTGRQSLGVHYALGSPTTRGTFTLLHGDDRRRPARASTACCPWPSSTAARHCGSGTTRAPGLDPLHRRRRPWNGDARSGPRRDARRTAARPVPRVRAALHGD